MSENVCPICKSRDCYRKVSMVKDGYTKRNPDGSYFFIHKGWREKIVEWWTCKECAKKFPVIEYNMKAVEHFTNFKDEVGDEYRQMFC